MWVRNGRQDKGACVLSVNHSVSVKYQKPSPFVQMSLKVSRIPNDNDCLRGENPSLSNLTSPSLYKEKALWGLIAGKNAVFLFWSTHQTAAPNPPTRSAAVKSTGAAKNMMFDLVQWCSFPVLPSHPSFGLCDIFKEQWPFTFHPSIPLTPTLHGPDYTREQWTL